MDGPVSIAIETSCRRGGVALGLGILEKPADIRQVMRNSVEIETYKPTDADKWADLRRRYAAMTDAV